MKVGVVGSRSFNDVRYIFEYLDAIKDITLLVSGGAKGPDSIAESWAKEHGIATQIFLPQWKTYGMQAGMLRNSQIVEASDMIIAFWDGHSKGTSDTISKCCKLRKPIKIILVVDQTNTLLDFT